MNVSRLRVCGLALIATACVALGVSSALAFPEPEIVPREWQLHFEWDAPGVISVKVPGAEADQLFGYIPYKVTNKTGSDQLFAPDVWIWTDAGELMQANRRVSPMVFKAIKQRLRNDLLESPVQIVGRLLQGEDNAREGVVMWPIGDRDVNKLRVFVGGLSGETQEVPNPVTGETLILRKTLMIEYSTPGDEIHASEKPFVLDGHEWIMR